MDKKPVVHTVAYPLEGIEIRVERIFTGAHPVAEAVRCLLEERLRDRDRAVFCTEEAD